MQRIMDFPMNTVYYDTGTQILEALEREDVDAIINGNMEYNMNRSFWPRLTICRRIS